MMSDGRRGSGREAADERHTSRRELLASSFKLIGAGAIVVASARWSTPVAAQDEGIGAGGRQGDDSGSTSTLPTAQDEGIGAGGRQEDGGGRRRRRDDANAPAGVGGGGRSTADPKVMAMPNTGIGDIDGEAASAARGVAPLLLAAGAVGAATIAMKTRAMPAATSRD